MDIKDRPVQEAIFYEDRNHIEAIGTDGLHYETRDGGETWVEGASDQEPASPDSDSDRA